MINHIHIHIDPWPSGTCSGAQGTSKGQGAGVSVLPDLPVLGPLRPGLHATCASLCTVLIHVAGWMSWVVPLHASIFLLAPRLQAAGAYS